MYVERLSQGVYFRVIRKFIKVPLIYTPEHETLLKTENIFCSQIISPKTNRAKSSS